MTGAASPPTTTASRRRSRCYAVFASLALLLAATPTPAAPFAYVGDGSSLDIFDLRTKTQVGGLYLGGNVFDVTVSPDGNTVFAIGGSGNGAIAFIDTCTRSILASVPVASGATALAVIPLGNELYVASADSGVISVV